MIIRPLQHLLIPAPAIFQSYKISGPAIFSISKTFYQGDEVHVTGYNVKDAAEIPAVLEAVKLIKLEKLNQSQNHSDFKDNLEDLEQVATLLDHLNNPGWQAHASNNLAKFFTNTLAVNSTFQPIHVKANNLIYLRNSFYS